MRIIDIQTPFSAPVYHMESTTSTFDIARQLAINNEPHGTVICADFQTAGRGRQNRRWLADKGMNLLFTILLRYENINSIPEALTLRTGLVVSLAIEDLVSDLTRTALANPTLTGLVLVKWPNDVIITNPSLGVMRKVSGILTESDGKNVYIGVGINVAQTEFSDESNAALNCKAGSITQFLAEGSPALNENARFILLEKFLSRLYAEIECPDSAVSWRTRLCKRLYKLGEPVIFAHGAIDSGNLIKGKLSGIGNQGELLIIPEGTNTEIPFITGELQVKY